MSVYVMAAKLNVNETFEPEIEIEAKIMPDQSVTFEFDNTIKHNSPIFEGMVMFKFLDFESAKRWRKSDSFEDVQKRFLNDGIYEVSITEISISSNLPR